MVANIPRALQEPRGWKEKSRRRVAEGGGRGRRRRGGKFQINKTSFISFPLTFLPLPLLSLLFPILFLYLTSLPLLCMPLHFHLSLSFTLISFSFFSSTPLLYLPLLLYRCPKPFYLLQLQFYLFILSCRWI